jgi:hypothetical protein
MFDFVKKFNGRPEICTKEIFLNIVRGKYVADTCKEIADLMKIRLEKVEQQLAASTEPGERAELEKQEKALWEQVAVLKKRLPAFCFHAHFKNGRRKNAEAEKSGLCMFDIDDISNPQATFDETRDRLKDLGVVLAHVTPSTRGLRYVFRVPEGMDITEAQQWFARQLDIRQYDGCTKDMARISYAVTEKYILFADEDGLFMNKDGQTKKNKESQACASSKQGNSAQLESSTQQGNSAQESKKSQKSRVTKVISSFSTQENAMPQKMNFKGIPYSIIIDRLLLNMGVDGEPVEGERNITLFALVRQLRYICDFSMEQLMKVVPRWGMSEEEVTQTVQSALSTVRRTDLPPHLQQILQLLAVQQKEMRMAKNTSGDEPDDESTKQTRKRMPVPERLPRLLTLLTKSFPREYQSTILMATLPILGTLATRARAVYFDGEEHSPSFLTCVVAPQASGKSCTRKLVDLLLHKLQLQDDAEREKERKWMEEKKARKNSKQQPEDPRVKVRIVPATISNAMLFKRLDCSEGEHLFTHAEEIDTLSKGRKSGTWSQKDDIMRQAFDNSVCGQDYMSDNSWSTMIHVYYNTLTCGTPIAVHRYYNDVEGGLVSRVCFAQLPDMLGAQMPTFGHLTADEKAEIDGWVDKLMAIGKTETAATEEHSEEGTLPKSEPVVYELPRIKQAIWDWMEARRLEYLETQEDPALDIFRRRSAVIGFRAGLIAMLVSDGKETDEAVDFATWVADYVLSEQLDLFGAEMNRLFEESENLAQRTFKRGDFQSLLSSLPDEFTAEQLVHLRMQLGFKSPIKQVIYRWTTNQIIEKTSKNTYKKLVSH